MGGVVPWGCSGTTILGAIGDGASNTLEILSGCMTRSIAASEADGFSLGGCTDWFLPSEDELNELYLQRAAVGGFADVSYWNSSQSNANVARGRG